jgi:hypothetical protein
MKTSPTLVVLLSSLALVACGGSAQTAAPAAEPTAAPAEEHHAEQFPAGPVSEYHEVLMPLWHADESPERAARTCDAAATLRERAQAIVDAPAPEAAKADEAAWKDAATALVGAIDAMITACAADGRPGFSAAFGAVHDAFHKLTELAGMKH